MHRTHQEVIHDIRDAFHEARLGDGVGLFEGRALDDYAECGKEDERINWDDIPRVRLESNNDALSFVDPEGMRFHLPAFMIAELEGANVSCIGYLVELDDWKRSKLALLSARQKQAVREFLHLVVDDPDYEFHRRRIRQALGEYWRADHG